MVLKSINSGLRTGRWMFLVMIVFLIFAVICEKNYTDHKYDQKDIERFTRVLHEKERKAEDILAMIGETLLKTERNEANSSIARELIPILHDDEALFFVYDHDSLVLWTSNAISAPEDLKDIPGAIFFNFHTTWVLKDSMVFNDFTVVSLLPVKSEYSYENRVLNDGFPKKFHLSPEVKILYPGNEELNAVYNKDGILLFSLDFEKAWKDDRFMFSLCILLYLIVFFTYLLFLRRFLKNAPKNVKNYLFLLVIFLLLVLYYVLHHYRVPAVLFNLELFSPGTFARSPVLPSLGDLSLLIVSIFFIIYNFYLEFYFNPAKLKNSNALRLGVGILSGIAIIALFYIQTFLVRSLVLDSSISFETYKVLDLSIYTYLGFTLIALAFTSYALIIDKVLGVFLALKKHREIGIFLAGINLSALVVFFLFHSGIYIESFIFFLLINFLIFYIRVWKRIRYSFSIFVIFVLIFSIYIVIEVVRLTEIKARGDMKIYAVNLSAEHDPVAELLFVDISSKIKEDEEVKALLFSPEIDFSVIYNEIQRKYFSGYLNKFDLQITLCKPEDNVYISPPEGMWHPCYHFFYEVIMSSAFQVSNTDFFYLDNMNGRISYFSPNRFVQDDDEMTLFIELDSRLLSEGLGYPELLLEQKLISNNYKNFSYAKFHQGKLISSSGTFSYRMNSDGYTEGNEGFQNSEVEGFDHVIYNLDRDNTIIVTKPAVMLMDILISFSYIFGFYFFLLIALLAFTGLSPLIYKVQWNFKNKIQFAMSSVLFISLLLIGTGTVHYSIRQYRNKHNDNLKEKLQSLYVELIHKLEFEQDLTSWSSDKYYDLEKLLQKFSNVFFSDINLYDENGRLLATSRPEIFDQSLIGRNMDALAYMEMVYNKRSEYIHDENIGGLTYLSAYVPFVNSENKLLAYLNLPYFTRQDELTSEIANLVVAIINIFVLLTLLTLTLAVFMANTITQPLRMIQEHISRFRLSENNEKINYWSRDEIGSLIDEYNKMIDQLEESAERLARSERESAWREMAKQVAHEIKNPLTPMRLIIQHIQRSLKDEENREQQLEKLSVILLEQIDNLSNIATEFSNFAKMPVARNEKLDLVSVILDVTKLFDKTENVDFSLNTGARKEYYIWADKEQISRVFINLFKNSIQSIQEGKRGLVEISLMIKNERLVVDVRDNGKGIPEEIRDRLFQPNFTTKTSGMGMGLAISKNIITSAGGEIRYSTVLKKGTVFVIEFPLLIE